jgi:hypothetical protein
MSDHSAIPLKKRSSCSAPIRNDLAEFPRHGPTPKFPIFTYQIHYFSISIPAIRPSYATHLARPLIFFSISQPTITLSLHSLRHFRDHSTSGQSHSKSGSFGHEEFWLRVSRSPSFSPILLIGWCCPAFLPSPGDSSLPRSFRFARVTSASLRFVSLTSTWLRFARLMSASLGFASVMSG